MDAEGAVAKLLLVAEEVDSRWGGFMTVFPSILERELDEMRVQVVPDNLGPIPVPGEPKYVGLPGWMKDELREKVLGALAKLDTVVREGVETQRFLASIVGSPTQLRAASALITSTVVGKATDFDAIMDGEPLLAVKGEAWESPAADTYAEAFRVFSRQTTPVATVAKTLASALNDAAKAIDDFYLALLKAVVFGAVGLYGFILTLSTGWTGVGAVVGIILSVVGLIGSLWAFYDLFAGTENTQGGIVDRVNGGPDLTWDQTVFAS